MRDRPGTWRGWRAGVLLCALLFFAPAEGRGQNPPPPPPPPDSVRPERGRTEAPDTATFRVPREVLPADTIPVPGQDTVPPDSARPAPVFPAFPQPDSAGWWNATWRWDREELLRFQGTSLLDLLVRIPGVVATRAGGFGQPVGIAPFGLGGGRMRLFIDGWEIDPLSSATVDLQQISLVDLEEVRMERRLDGIRVEVTYFRLPDRRPFSQIEAATGDPEVRFLRGLYSQVVGGRSVLTLGFDLTDTEGFRRQEPFGVTSAVARWSYAFAPDAGVQLEYRQVDVERPRQLVELGTRRELIARGRWSPAPGLHLDALAGRLRRSSEGARDRFEDAQVDQLGARALYTRGRGWIEGDARFRSPSDDAFAVPRADLALRGGVRPFAGLEAEGAARLTRTGGESGSELRGTVRGGPWNGFSPFASLAVGSRGVGVLTGDTILQLLPDTAGVAREDTIPTFGVTSSALSALRTGVEWSRPGVLAGAAFLRLDPDRVAPFGLPFDVGLPPVDTEAATGFEGFVSAPVLDPALRLRGAYTLWTETGGHPYLPDHEARLGLEFHRLYYTGNLEPTAWVEVVRRGAARIPVLDEDGVPTFVVSEPYTLFNAFLQVRVIDVRAFILFENVFNVRTAADLPERPFPGARVLYGVRWHFRN